MKQMALRMKKKPNRIRQHSIKIAVCQMILYVV